MKTKKQLKSIINKTMIIVFIVISNFSYSQLTANCGDDFHGIGHVHLDCVEDIVITSTIDEGNEGTIIAGIIFSYGNINITPGFSSVRIVSEIETEVDGEARTHRTKVGGNGGKTGGRYSNMLFDPKLNIKTYPNPTKNLISISTNTFKISNYTVSDLFGNLLKTKSIVPSNNFIITTQDLNKGIYFLKLQLDNGVIHTEKIIKQ